MVSDVSPTPAEGGGTRMLWEQSSRLVARGHDVRVVCRATTDGEAATAERQGVRIRRFAVDRRTVRRFVVSSVLGARRVVTLELRDAPADVLHVHQPLAGVGVLMSPAVRGLPRLYSFHSPAPLEFRSRRGMTAHHRSGWAGRIGLTALWGTERACLRRATAIHVLSDYSAEQLWKLYGVPRDRVVKIPGAADTTWFRPAADRAAVRTRLGLPAERPLLLTVRNLERRMGLDLLIRAMAILKRDRPEALLLIGGVGSVRQELESFSEALGLREQVRFLGFIPDEALPLYYQAADVFILPTRARGLRARDGRGTRVWHARARDACRGDTGDPPHALALSDPPRFGPRDDGRGHSAVPRGGAAGSRGPRAPPRGVPPPRRGPLHVGPHDGRARGRADSTCGAARCASRPAGHVFGVRGRDPAELAPVSRVALSPMLALLELGHRHAADRPRASAPLRERVPAPLQSRRRERGTGRAVRLPARPARRVWGPPGIQRVAPGRRMRRRTSPACRPSTWMGRGRHGPLVGGVHGCSRERGTRRSPGRRRPASVPGRVDRRSHARQRRGSSRGAECHPPRGAPRPGPPRAPRDPGPERKLPSTVGEDAERPRTVRALVGVGCVPDRPPIRLDRAGTPPSRRARGIHDSGAEKLGPRSDRRAWVAARARRCGRRLRRERVARALAGGSVDRALRAEGLAVIRVLHVITRLTVGGSPENTVATVVALARAGYACTLAVSFRESVDAVLEDARRRGCRLVDVPSLGREVALASDVAAVYRLLRLIGADRPHIVHTHTSKAGFVGRLAARIARVPAVIHQPHGHVFYGYFGPRRTAVYTALERRAAAWCDRIITLTERGTDEHLARGIGSPAQYVTVPSGVPTARLRATAPSRPVARARLEVEAEAYLVVGFGRLVPIKGFDLLDEALPRLRAGVPTARVLLVGDGPERAALERRAEVLGVADRLHVTGIVTDVVTPLAAADVVAAPSRNEGMGRALVEAMALGIPVVGAAVGGIPAVLVDGD